MGSPIRSKAVNSGRNFDVGQFPDDRYVRCSRCNFINNLDREIHSYDGGYEGWGTSFNPQSSTSSGSGYGPGSPYAGGLQTGGPAGQVMYSTSYGPTDVLVNSYGSFSFASKNIVLLNTTSTGAVASLLLIYTNNIYAYNISTYVIKDDSGNTIQDNSSNVIDDDTAANTWMIYSGIWASITGDPRLLGTIDTDITWDSNGQWDGTGSWDSENLFVETVMDAVVGAGCSQCGSLLYNKD